MVSKVMVVAVLGFMALTASATESQVDGEWVRVYKYDPTTKPTVNAGRYEWRKVNRTYGRVDASLVCDDCMVKIAGPSATKPTVASRNEVYTCMNCGKMVCRDNAGKEAQFTDAKDQEALNAIGRELKKPAERTTTTTERFYSEPAFDNYHGTKPTVQDKFRN